MSAEIQTYGPEFALSLGDAGSGCSVPPCLASDVGDEELDVNAGLADGSSFA